MFVHQERKCHRSLRTSAYTTILALMATSGTACIFIDEINVDPTIPSPSSDGEDPHGSHDSDQPCPTTTDSGPDDGESTCTAPDSGGAAEDTGAEPTTGEQAADTGDAASETGATSETGGSSETGEAASTGGSSETGDAASETGASSTGEGTGETGASSTGEATPVEMCGNGVVDPGEACDDGNTLDDDACNHECQRAGCGDGILQVGEDCDSATASATCESLGLAGGVTTCDLHTCKFNLGLCDGCGNGSIAGAELCDGADLGGASCESLGFWGGVLACDGQCGAHDTSGCFEVPPEVDGCCVAGDLGSCSVDTVQACVCGHSPECCEDAWSERCVELAITACFAQCF